jgi:hypothetical protein
VERGRGTNGGGPGVGPGLKRGEAPGRLHCTALYCTALSKNVLDAGSLGSGRGARMNMEEKVRRGRAGGCTAPLHLPSTTVNVFYMLLHQI